MPAGTRLPAALLRSLSRSAAGPGPDAVVGGVEDDDGDDDDDDDDDGGGGGDDATISSSKPTASSHLPLLAQAVTAELKQTTSRSTPFAGISRSSLERHPNASGSSDNGRAPIDDTKAV